jgi:hypothetical protein
MDSTDNDGALLQPSLVKRGLGQIVRLLRANISVGLFSLLIAASALLVNYNQNKNLARQNDLVRMREIISQLQNPAQNPAINNPIGKLMATSELDRIFRKHPDFVSAELLLSTGTLVFSGYENKIVPNWYRNALLLMDKEKVDDPLLRTVAHWYLAAELEKAGKQQEADRHFETASSYLLKIPMTKRKTLELQIRISRAVLLINAGKFAECKKIADEVQQAVSSDGRWIDFNTFNGAWRDLNNCQPMAVIFGPPPESKTQSQ